MLSEDKDLWSEDKDKDLRFKVKTRTCNLVFEDPQGQGLSSRTTTLVTTMPSLATENNASNCKVCAEDSMFSITRDPQVSQHVSLTRDRIILTDCLQNAEFSTVFEDSVVQGQVQELKIRGQDKDLRFKDKNKDKDL